MDLDADLGWKIHAHLFPPPPASNADHMILGERPRKHLLRCSSGKGVMNPRGKSHPLAAPIYNTREVQMET